jgi:hydrogenase expression/formation protein HypE
MAEREIVLAHGSGGRMMQTLIEELFLDAFSNPLLDEREDQARIALAGLVAQGDRLALSTDSYVIDPIFFPGGDIGKLAVCGTANDVAVGGGVPRYMTCAFILEEGLAYADLQRIVRSMASTAREAGIELVTGDTKVVPRGAADKIFINTTGLGVIPQAVRWGASSIRPGDRIIVSGTLGDHGATILNLREGLGFSADLRSDCALLAPLIAPLRSIRGVRAVRDATRGGVTAILHEFAQASGCAMSIDEPALPVGAAVRGLCELLGLDPLNFANEGKLLLVVDPDAVPAVLEALRAHPLGRDAALIGEAGEGGQVNLRGPFGVSRRLDLPFDEPLPRIC